eukprot:1157166-Pelagomonas_calceolata.AAC.2
MAHPLSCSQDVPRDPIVAVPSPTHFWDGSSEPMTIEPLCKLGLTKEKALKLATKLHYHAVNTFTT